MLTVYSFFELLLLWIGLRLVCFACGLCFGVYCACCSLFSLVVCLRFWCFCYVLGWYGVCCGYCCVSFGVFASCGLDALRSVIGLGACLVGVVGCLRLVAVGLVVLRGIACCFLFWLVVMWFRFVRLS